MRNEQIIMEHNNNIQLNSKYSTALYLNENFKLKSIKVKNIITIIRSNYYKLIEFLF